MLTRILLCAAALVAAIDTPSFAQCTNAVEVGTGGKVVTNWSHATQSHVPGADDQWGVPQSSDGSNPMWAYGPNRLPDYQDYLTSNYALNSYSHSIALGVMQTLHNTLLTNIGANVPFKLYNPHVGNVMARIVADGPNCVKIVHGLVIANSFVTVILPPHWTPTPATPYPIIVNPFYDVNDNFFAGFGLSHKIARWVARSGLPGNTGAIGVIWNGGGAVSSTTTNVNARYQFAAIIDYLATYAGGNRYNILMGGGSRGGTATLMLASNPEGLNYKVTFAVATGAGTKIGTHVNLISATMPAQLPGLGSAGFANGWLPGWTYPAGGRPAMFGLTGKQSLLRLISGDPNPANVDATRSPISPNFISGLLAAQTQVLLSFGSHDEYIPFNTEAEYLFALRAAGVPVEAHIIARGGHGSLPDIWTRLRLAFFSHFDPNVSSSHRYVQTGNQSISYYKLSAAGALIHIGYADQPFPFTLEVPRVQYVGTDIVVMATGQPGTELCLETNQTPPTYCGVIGANYSWNSSVPATGAGVIAYTAVRIRKPGSAVWQPLDTTYVPATSPMALNTTIIPGPIPNISGRTMWWWIRFAGCALPSPPGMMPPPGPVAALPCVPRIPGWSDTNWGIAEY